MDFLSQAAKGLSNLTLVTPLLSPNYTPIDANGNSLGSGLVFDYEGENTVVLQSEITDHFIETNSTISDNIALKPEKITVHGFIGELTNLFPGGVPPASQVFSVLSAVSAFAPSFSVSALNVIGEASQAYQAAASAVKGAVSAWATINGQQQETVISANGIFSQGANQNKQQVMFSQLYGYWSRQLQINPQTQLPYPPVLFQVQTPWAIFSPCAIEEMRTVQDEKTNSMTDFFVTFKMLRFVSTTGVPNLSAAGRAANQVVPLVNNGNASLTDAGSTSSIFSSGF